MLWSLWLCRNKVIFEANQCSPMQVIFHCAHLLREWSSLQKPEHRDLYTAVCSRLEQVAKDIFFLHGWRHDRRIESTSSPQVFLLQSHVTTRMPMRPFPYSFYISPILLNPRLCALCRGQVWLYCFVSSRCKHFGVYNKSALYRKNAVAVPTKQRWSMQYLREIQLPRNSFL